VPLQFAAGSGPVVVVVTWDGGGCIATVSRTVAPWPGVVPRLLPHFPRADGEGATWTFSTKDCAVGVFQFRLRGLAGAKHARAVRTFAGENCQWERDRVRFGRFDLTTEDGRGARMSVQVAERNQRSGFVVFDYHVSFNGKPIVSGWLDLNTIHISGTPARRIYQGTDAFVNYCIDEGKRIKSSHHRLYCVRPGEDGFYETRVRSGRYG
jgi:hypothetical protein